MIATTMEKMNADRGLPALQVLKFDGSPENYPVFRGFSSKVLSDGRLEGLRRANENGPADTVP